MVTFLQFSDNKTKPKAYKKGRKTKIKLEKGMGIAVQ